MLLRRVLVLGFLAAAVLSSPVPAAAQISRLGVTFNVFTAPTRGSAIAYDIRNDVYLAVSAYGVLRGRFINADGVPLAPEFVIQASANFTHFPRVAYSPDADGGAGGFLVTWHESDAPITSVHCRMVSFTHGVIGADTRVAGSSSFWEVGAAVAYAGASQEFLIVWRAFAPGDIVGVRVGNAGTVLGAPFAVANTGAHEDNPNVTYNPTTDEFMVVHSAITDPPLHSILYGRRVKPGTGQVIGAPSNIGEGVGIYITDVAYDSLTGLYLATWYQDPPKALYGRLLNADGSPAGGIGALSSRYRAYDALGLAHNRTSGTFFAISHDSISSEDGGVEIDRTGNPLSTGLAVTAAGGGGNFYPRIAAHGVRPEWIAVTAGSFVATLAQRLSSAAIGGVPPLVPPLPPQTPPTAPTAQVSTNRTALSFGILAGTNTLGTPAQQVAVKFANGTSTWSVSSSVPWLDVAPASGSGTGTFSVSLKPGRWSTGAESAALTISAPGAGNGPLTLPITVAVRAAGGNPSGVVDTPANNLTGVTGALPVTGWVLDDIGPKAVTVWRDPVAGETPPPGNGKVFLGRAVFVEGARPDVAAATTLPFGYKAGWGFMVLTNMLPNQGNGTFTLHAFAEDLDGHTVLLGSRTITCANATATTPFGAIDTPDQGETVSGTVYTNFGWILTPQPNRIPEDGSTIMVHIDGVPVGRPDYGHNRADISSLFPALKNSTGAVGFFNIDTTSLANGVHTIAWSVVDSAGTPQGIGSRYFSVLNAAASSSLTLDRSVSVQALTGGGPEIRESAVPGVEHGKPIAAVTDVTASDVPIYTRNGFDPRASLERVETGPDGVALVQANEAGRVALTLGPSALDDGEDGYQGYLVADGKLNPLPAGAFLDKRSGDFYWHPGVGFVGDYELLFIWTDQGHRRRIPVRVRVRN